MNKHELLAEIEVAPVRELVAIDAKSLVVAESRRVTHHVTLAPGARLDDTLIPDFWSLAAPKLHRLDLVEITPGDASYWALLLVTEVGPEFAKTALLLKVDLPAHPLTVDDLPLGHSVFYLGSKRLWAALRGDQILRHGFTDKGSAVAWLIETTRG